MIPRFSLVSPAIPKLRNGEESIVYQALTPHGQTRSVEELVERCCALGIKQIMKHPPAPLPDTLNAFLTELEGESVCLKKDCGLPSSRSLSL